MSQSSESVRDARARSLARFARIVARPEPEIDLALGALVAAGHGRAPLDEDAYLARLDAHAELVRVRLDAGDPPAVVADRLHDVLYRELGYRAPSAAEFGDPANSLFDRVLNRRIGLPISLAIVEIETARRIGLPLVGIGLPGHFIVGGPDDSLFDPAGGGRSLTRDDCQALLQRAIGDGILLNAGMLRPTGPRQILARVLRNLRAAHLARQIGRLPWTRSISSSSSSRPTPSTAAIVACSSAGWAGSAKRSRRSAATSTSGPTHTTCRTFARCSASSQGG